MLKQPIKESQLCFYPGWSTQHTHLCFCPSQLLNYNILFWILDLYPPSSPCSQHCGLCEDGKYFRNFLKETFSTMYLNIYTHIHMYINRSEKGKYCLLRKGWTKTQLGYKPVFFLKITVQRMWFTGGDIFLLCHAVFFACFYFKI